ncbi:hypothetical protein CEUSTIGMA_g13091.t1 [Chlamydomonas eustigma]|uniref:Uncharacterized protein n=1 Tax=Chlamydomonas eustigma TaxID=1157962 RepID=A0A250XRH2_9CHLO|nr:hypothetical protein CEUSTIGMA_g13091.t1 [Chlamydomonas eustigma]|eukprot:GAX85677.1 hypothetical protein CEUSTIGMA_g13091.t1 [Chlamydomonas eustigma]
MDPPCIYNANPLFVGVFAKIWKICGGAVGADVVVVVGDVVVEVGDVEVGVVEVGVVEVGDVEVGVVEVGVVEVGDVEVGVVEVGVVEVGDVEVGVVEVGVVEPAGFENPGELEKYRSQLLLSEDEALLLSMADDGTRLCHRFPDPGYDAGSRAVA